MASKETLKEWKEFRRDHMDADPITVHALVNYYTYTSALIDSGSLSYCLVSRSFVRRARLERISVPARAIVGVNDHVSYVREVVKFTLDLDGFSETLFAYVMPNDIEEDLILRRPWMNRNHVTIAPAKKSIYIHVVNLRIRSQEGRTHPMEIREVGATAFQRLMEQSRDRKRKPEERTRVFAASLADINKALTPKP